MATSKTTRPRFRASWRSSTPGSTSSAAGNVGGTTRGTRFIPAASSTGWSARSPAAGCMTTIAGSRYIDVRCSMKSASMASCIGSYRYWRTRAGSASARSRSIIARASSAPRSTASRRFIKGLLDLLTVRFLTRFGQRPMHVMGGTGLVLFLIGALGMLVPGGALGRPGEPADRQSAALDLLGEPADRRHATGQPRHPGRAGHVVQHPGRRHLQHRRDVAPPDRLGAPGEPPAS